jgi:hypothetical protein
VNQHNIGGAAEIPGIPEDTEPDISSDPVPDSQVRSSSRSTKGVPAVRIDDELTFQEELLTEHYCECPS